MAVKANAFWSVLNFRPGHRKSLAEIVKKIPVFQGLSKFELNFVINIMHRRHFLQDELIFREGEAGNGMYLLESGTVKILGRNREGEEVLYTRLNDHQFFGELALIDGAPRSATAIAEKESVLFGFFKPDLLDLIQKNPTIGSKILLNLSSVLAERLRTMNQQVLELQAELEAKAV